MPTHHTIPNSCFIIYVHVHVGGVKSKPRHSAQPGRRYVYTRIHTRVSFSFLPKGGGGGQNEIVWIIGGQVSICVQSIGQTRGIRGHAPPRNFVFCDLLLDAIWWNLELFLHKHNSPFIVSLKLL